MADHADIAALSFEQALAELEKIVAELESGQAPLERSIEVYERGAALKAHCEKKLEAARQRWDASKIKDYDMEYTKRTAAAESLETYRVEVRGGEVVKVVRTPGEVGKDSQWHAIEERLYPYHSVPALFGFM